MRRNRFCLALLIAGMTAALAAQNQTDWLVTRQREFATWQAAHRGLETQVRDLKTKTAALIAAHVPPKAGAKYADLKTRSARMSATQRQQALNYFDSAYRWLDLLDYTSAKEFFDLGLTLDPADVAATYHRGTIFRRDAERTLDPYLRSGYRAMDALFMDRVLSLGPNTPDAKKAALAILDLPPVSEEANVALAPVIWRVPGAPKELWDAPYAPPLVIIPAGEYTMGATLAENAGELYRKNTALPRHRVRIGYPLAVGKYPVTRAEFAAFVADTRFDSRSAPCNILGAGPGGTWENPGFPQTDNDPAACISYDVAMAYVAWLSRKTGHTYRLPSESEWEYAARAGTTTAFYWGDDVGAGNANCPRCGSQWDLKSTSPVGSFAPNPFGLYDVVGNIWEVVGDCWNYSFAAAPRDGSAWRAGNCANSLEKGGSFNQGPEAASPSHRGGRADPKGRGLNIHGFRVVREL